MVSIREAGFEDAKNYFQVHSVPEEHKVEVAVLFLGEKVDVWY